MAHFDLNQADFMNPRLIAAVGSVGVMAGPAALVAGLAALAQGGPFSDSIHEDEDGRLSWRSPTARAA